ncbi:MAG TPA: serine hydrolase [Bryobacteraceae bacterium]|nr:serine hydrolase [Bryobacteraceae bacterium]
MRYLLLTFFIMTLARADALADKIQSAVAGFSGSVSIFARNLDSGKTFALRADDKVRTASTIKLAILAATFEAVEEGKVKWTDLSTLHEADKVSGSGVLGNEFSAGDRLPLADLVHLMIVLSDNTATNLVLDRITADYVNAYMDKLGFPNTRSMRKIRGDGANLKEAAGFSKAGLDPANRKFGLGSTTPREIVGLIEKMERGEVVSPAASREMIKILKRQQDHNGIARKMGDTPVANKAGALDHLRADVGIVYSKGGRIAMAIYCDDVPQVDWSSDNPALLEIAKLSEILLNGLAK